MTSALSQSDLSLTAIRYLAGELDAAETDAFEQRLAADAVAQQALVHAVQISAAVLAGSPAAPVVRPVRIAAGNRPTSTSRRASVAALVSSGLVAAAVLLALRAEPESVAVVSSGDSGSDATVSLWTELDVEEIEAALDEPSLVTVDGAEFDAVQVPDWMFAAIETDVAAGNEAVPQSGIDATDEDS